MVTPLFAEFGGPIPPFYLPPSALLVAMVAVVVPVIILIQ